MSRLILITGLPLLLALGGCQGGSNAASPSSREQAQQQWRQQKPDAYQLTVYQECFCLPEHMAPVQVTVENDQPRAELADSDGPLPEQMRHLERTVEDWFDLIVQGEQQQWHRLAVDYHPQLGYPQQIEIDRHPMLADDESRFHIKLTPLPGRQH